MKQLFLSAILLISSTSLYAQVGIGTTTPKAFFNVATGKDVLFGQDVFGLGNKLIWNATRGAFRAGYVNDIQWNPALLGQYSFASGLNTQASGSVSTAMGNGASATAANATALGYYTIATASFSTALGYLTSATADYSTALGNHVSTNGKNGAFIIGDNSGLINYSNTAINQMMMRFSGGYILYSSNPTDQATAVGVQLASFGNAWQTLSDSTRKENFRKADGASFLQKISQMRLGSWNYKGQDAKQYRHYGPMAQDFFAAFGRDEVGIIGEDKSINQADFDGVNLIAIQALINEVNQLKAENQALRRVTQVRLDKLEALLMNRPADTMITFKP